MDAVQADRIWIRLPGDLIVLTGQVFHAAHLTPQLIDVTDLTDPTDALKIFYGMLRHSLSGGANFFLKDIFAPALYLMHACPPAKKALHIRREQSISAMKTTFPTKLMSGVHSFVNPWRICPNFVQFFNIFTHVEIWKLSCHKLGKYDFRKIKLSDKNLYGK